MVVLNDYEKEILKDGKRFLEKNDVEGFLQYLEEETDGQIEPYANIVDFMMEKGINPLHYFKQEIPSGALFDTSIKEVMISNGIRVIEDYAFADCHKLKEVTISSSVNYIGECAFRHCNSLEKISLSQGLVSIEDAAFSHCIHLKEIHLPSSLEDIGDDVFENCFDLKIYCEFDPKNINWPDWTHYATQIEVVK